MWTSCFGIFLLFNAINIDKVRCNCDSLNKKVYIRHLTTLLAVEENWPDNSIRLKTKTDNFADQQWIFQPSKRHGLFNIDHVGRNGTAFDLDLNYDPETDSFNATQTVFTDELTQQWFIHSDGTIVNGAANNHVLKANGDNAFGLSYIFVGPRTGNQSDVFIFDYDS